MSKLGPQSDFKLSPISIDFVSELKSIFDKKKDFIIKISGEKIDITLGNTTETIEKIDDVLPWIKNQIKNNK